MWTRCAGRIPSRIGFGCEMNVNRLEYQLDPKFEDFVRGSTKERRSAFAGLGGFEGHVETRLGHGRGQKSVMLPRW